MVFHHHGSEFLYASTGWAIDAWLSILAASAAILLSAAFFFSVLSPDARRPNGFIYLAYAGAALLAIGLVVLGIGLLRKDRN